MSNKDLSALTKEERRFYNMYMNYINAVWHEYYDSRGTSKAMSITERERQLKMCRDRLDKINRKLNR